MKIALAYGRSGLTASVPDDVDAQILRFNALPQVENESQVVEESFRSPIGCAPLDKLARGRESACIVISDVTRPVPNETILRPMLDCLHDSGLSRDQITILVATGLHRPNEGAELEEMIGAPIKNRYRVLNHDARDFKTQTKLGEIAFEGGTAEVALNSAYLNADLKIATGLIEPHFMAGYSGGRKLICPGIASADTIAQFHSPRMIGDANSYAGNLRGNPIHAMSRAVAGTVGVDFICNVTLSEERRITGVFSGDLDAAHQSGIVHVDRQTKIATREADIVLTTCAGYPLDTTLYQAVKGMVCALPAVKTGGTIILAAEMSQGLGGEEFSQMCRTLSTRQEFIQRIYGSDVVYDQWQLQKMMQVLQKCEVMVVSSGIAPQTLRDLLLIPMPTIEDALQAALLQHGARATLNIIPEGPYVTPVPQPEMPMGMAKAA